MHHDPGPQALALNLQTFEWRNVKQKTIEEDLGIFTHILLHSCIFRDI